MNMNVILNKSQITLISLESVEVSKLIRQLPQSNQPNTILDVDVGDEDDEDVSPIRFIKNNSSNQSDGPKVPSEEFEMEQAASCTRICLSGVNIEIEGRDFDALSIFIAQQELALKHTSNVFDIYSIFNQAVQPRPLLLPTTSLAVEMRDFSFLLFGGSTRQKVPKQPLIEFGIGSLEVELGLGGTRDISCIEVKAKVKQIILIDLFSEVIEVYDPTKDEFSELSSS